jgi:hypothetical protein
MTRIELILLWVRRVRNNLFHGGKFNGHWFQPERSEQLITASLVVIHAFRGHGELNKAYLGLSTPRQASRSGQAR